MQLLMPAMLPTVLDVLQPLQLACGRELPVRVSTQSIHRAVQATVVSVLGVVSDDGGSWEVCVHSRVVRNQP